MTTIYAIDPGNEQSAWVELADGVPINHGKVDNDVMLRACREQFRNDHLLAIEMIASYGMPVGREVFETCLWIGRFQEAFIDRGGSVELIYRKDVKLFHCGTSRANDANIRAALLDRFGPGRDKAIGTKKNPGPLYGIVADQWSALAIATTVDGRI